MLAVALLAASPVGELLVAYPVGLALGLAPHEALAASLAGNLAPIPPLLALMSLLRRRFQRAFAWLERRAGIYRKWVGIPAFLALTPIAGVYATTVAMRALGYSLAATAAVQAASLAAYGLGLYLGSLYIHLG